MTISPVLSDDTIATLLLCARFGHKHQIAKSLTQSEFHKLDNLLKDQNLTPGNLLGIKPKFLNAICLSQGKILDQISSLLKQRKELDESISLWSKAGIWVIGERDKEYPSRLLHRLKTSRPPLLFGAGPPDLLNSGGICIVGSRNSPETALKFSSKLGDRCADEGMTVISSDMRGVDREAVTSALERQGRVIIVLSDRLEKAVFTKRYRRALAEGLLTMVTPFSPNSGFSVSKAVRTNRYQYALSDVAVIAESRGKGGIWSGADENRIEGWVPAFVRTGKSMSQGNLALHHLGLSPITRNDIENIKSLREFFLNHTMNHKKKSEQHISDKSKNQRLLDLYSLFLTDFQNLVVSKPMTEAEIASLYNIEKIQIRKWLEKAEEDGVVKKTAPNKDEPAWKPIT